MNKHIKAAAFFILLIMSVAACGAFNASEPTPTVQTDDGFDRRAMLENITTNVIVPAHEEFADTLADLELAARAFTDDPTPATLTAVQDAWRTASLARMALLSFRIGPVDDSLLHNRLDNRPPRIKFIDETIISGKQPITNDYLASIGSSSVGLGTMEYLLFDPENSNDVVLEKFTDAENADRRRELILRLAENAQQRSNELAAIWSADGDNYAQAFIAADMDGGELQGSMNMLVNQMISDVEEIVASRLGKPAGKRTNGAIRPDLVESLYAQQSLPRLIATLKGMQLAFNGGEGLGFDDYLDYLDADYEDGLLSTAINTQFDTAIAALQAIDQPLETSVTSDLPAVETAFEEINQLLVLLKVDMANHLGVTLTFNDNDGD